MAKGKTNSDTKKTEADSKTGANSKRPNIPTKTQNVLWARAGGRCEFEGCNELLCEDWLTGKTINGAQVAHIRPIAKSARYKKGQPKKLKTDINNLMLLCYKHHHLVDFEAPEEYPEDRLQTMKQKHEERVKRATEVQDNKQTLVVLYAANIANDTPYLSFRDAQLAISPQFFCAEHSPVRIQLMGVLKETDNGFWDTEDKNLMLSVQRLVLEPLKQAQCEHVSLFAIAPQPLLVRLGTLLNEKIPVRVFQKIRDLQTWNWQEGEPFEFSVIEPDDKTKHPVMIFAISADTIIERTKAYYKDNASVWIMTTDNPNTNIMLSEKQLDAFRASARSFVELVSKSASEAVIDVHMAMPVSCAVELGRVWMSKAHKDLQLYENNDKFIQTAIKIQNE